jgi:hypothetical protein
MLTPVLREDARKRLKKFFNERDYPPVEEVARKFSIDWDYLSFSTPDEISEIAPEIFEEQRDKAARQWADALRDIQYGLRVGLCKLGRGSARKAYARSKWSAQAPV